MPAQWESSKLVTSSYSPPLRAALRLLGLMGAFIISFHLAASVLAPIGFGTNYTYGSCIAQRQGGHLRWVSLVSPELAFGGFVLAAATFALIREWRSASHLGASAADIEPLRPGFGCAGTPIRWLVWVYLVSRIGRQIAAVKCPSALDAVDPVHFTMHLVSVHGLRSTVAAGAGTSLCIVTIALWVTQLNLLRRCIRGLEQDGLIGWSLAGIGIHLVTLGSYYLYFVGWILFR